MKPLGHKSYGSIPHLSNSRLGSGDYHCEMGQEKIATIKSRDKFDLVVVQEKLDGSNVAIAKINGEILALNRAGYLADTSPFEQHHYFTKWVEQQKNRFDKLLKEGERIVGEWLLQAHGTRYNLPHEPFVAFDIMTKHRRTTYNNFLQRIKPFEIVSPRLIHMGNPVDTNFVLKEIEVSGHGAIDPVEGAIWRVERKEEVDFLVKFVRKDKEDGIFLPEKSGNDPIWNYDLKKITLTNNL